MSMTTPCCSDPTPYADSDEIRCRSCHRSISHPPRSPDDGGVEPSGHQKASMDGQTSTLPTVYLSCVRCRIQTSGVRLNCPSCQDVLVKLESTTRALGHVYVLPPFTPPRLLNCRCCGWDLPQFSFYHHPKQPNREYRFATCRRCCSSQARARRAADPDGYRKRSQEYSRKIQAERVAGERPPVRESQTEDQKERALQATQRYRARSNGRPVPKLKAGGKSIYITPMCRAVDCPLRLLKT